MFNPILFRVLHIIYKQAKIASAIHQSTKPHTQLVELLLKVLLKMVVEQLGNI